MQNQKNSIHFLLNVLDQRQKANRHYSLRAFAKNLNVSPGALSQLLAYKRPLSPKLASKIFDRLNVKPYEKRKMLDGLSGKNDTPAKHIDDDLFNIVSDWYHFAILNLFETSDFRGDVAWISKRLNIPVTTGRLALKRLENALLIRKTTNGYQLCQSNLETSDGIKSSAIRNAQKQLLQKSINAIENIDLEYRDISSIQFAINIDQIPKAREQIRRFQTRLGKLLKVGIRNDVYSLNVQLIPMSTIQLKGD